jgi:hypothetical protein
MQKPSCEELTEYATASSRIKREYDTAAISFALPKMLRLKEEFDTIFEASTRLATFEFARRTFDEQFFGGWEIYKAFGIKIETEKLPPIPFTRYELTFAKINGLGLIYRPAFDSSTGTPLTIANQLKFLAENKGVDVEKIVFDYHIQRDEPYFNNESPRDGWALVGSPPLFLGKNFLDQSIAIDQFLIGIHEKISSHLPSRVKMAHADLEAKEPEIRQLLEDIKKHRTKPITELNRKFAEKLVALKVNEQYRPTLAETIYDNLMFRSRNQTLHSLYALTNTLSDDKKIMCALLNPNEKLKFVQAIGTLEAGVAILNWTK